MSTGEIVLKVGGEGGSLTLLRIKAASGWRFRVIRDESTLRGLLNEEDCEGLEFWSQSDWIDSWESALAHLDKHPWHLFVPLRVHPDFKRQISMVVRKRFRKDKHAEEDTDWNLHRLECWRRLLD